MHYFDTRTHHHNIFLFLSAFAKTWDAKVLNKHCGFANILEEYNYVKLMFVIKINLLQTCWNWFSQCLPDLEPNTQKNLFNEKLLKMEVKTMTHSAFTCFFEFFRAVNLNDRKIITSGDRQVSCIGNRQIYYIFIIYFG